MLQLSGLLVGEVKESRNEIHPAGDRPEREEVEVMIDFIQRICLPWEAPSVPGRTRHSKA